uniref:SWIM-type domain-containing protein n=1 Tax=Ananas comosus var. bracteatus TaxID=296719 RepID=A0A6V7PUG9_ANACO|nr:unnamed protein product [Ananas comosus var. bracteatus]
MLSLLMQIKANKIKDMLDDNYCGVVLHFKNCDASRKINGSGYFTMEIHHKGFFAFIPDRFYMGGKIDYYDFCDPDLLSLLDIKDKAKDDLGYPDEEQVNYYWCKPGSSLNLGIEKLNNDKDVCEMALHASKTTRVALYMEPMIVTAETSQTILNDMFRMFDDTEQTIPKKLNDDGRQDDHVIAEELDNRDEEMGDGEKDHANRSDDESDSLFIESDYDLTDDDELFDKNVDTHVEVDELHSVDDSSEDDLVMRRRYPEFRAETDMQNPQFGIGMFFASMKEFRQAIREYSIKNRYNIKLVKNEKDKVRAVKKSNPGSTLFIKCDNLQFKMLYVCLDACKRGFLAGCRPIISLDGCFLKSQHGEQLLAAVGVDANDCIFPIAYAVVDVESTASWAWFLSHLLQDLQIQNSAAWTFMSDKQKVIGQYYLQSHDLVPNAEHRFCVRHLYSNFQNSYKGKLLKDYLWAAAKASYVAKFEHWMGLIKETDAVAYEWLVDKPPQQWSMSHFREFPKCDMLLNNMCECFNRYILEARAKPILSMLEAIRCKMMNRLYMKMEAAEKYNGSICPKIIKKFEKLKEQSAVCWPQPAGSKKFQVGSSHGQFVVDLIQKTCSCRRWDLTGLPCPHAISAMLHENLRPEDSVHDCCSIETYKKCYEHLIKPINGQDMWTKTGQEPIQSPDNKKRPGRPKMARKKSASELQTSNKLGRHGVRMTCTKCGEKGHNKATCNRRSRAGVRPLVPKLPVRRNRAEFETTNEATPTPNPIQPTLPPPAQNMRELYKLKLQLNQIHLLFHSQTSLEDANYRHPVEDQQLDYNTSYKVRSAKEKASS